MLLHALQAKPESQAAKKHRCKGRCFHEEEENRRSLLINWAVGGLQQVVHGVVVPY